MKTAFVVALAVFMLLSGTVNTVTISQMNKIKAVGKDPSLGKQAFFNPLLQSLFMFFGEFLCLIVFLVYRLCKRRSADKKGEISKPSTMKQKVIQTVKFAIPAAFDFTGSTTMNLGLIFTTASVYQMLRGSLVVITALFGVIFLKRRLLFHHFVGLTFVVVGITVVALSSILFKDPHEPAKDRPLNAPLGAALVVIAQIFAAGQMTVEEKLITGGDPLQAVGSEGIFGMLYCAIAIPIAQYVMIPPFKGYGDVKTGAYMPLQDFVNSIHQMGNEPTIIALAVGSLFSIAVLNFTGVSVTKHLSAIHRTTIDACRVALVWIVDLAFSFENFEVKSGLTELTGFIILTFGTFVYNGIIPMPNKFMSQFLCGKCFDPKVLEEQSEGKDNEKQRLLVNSDLYDKKRSSSFI